MEADERDYANDSAEGKDTAEQDSLPSRELKASNHGYGKDGRHDVGDDAEDRDEEPGTVLQSAQLHL